MISVGNIGLNTIFSSKVECTGCEAELKFANSAADKTFLKRPDKIPQREICLQSSSDLPRKLISPLLVHSAGARSGATRRLGDEGLGVVRFRAPWARSRSVYP
jgi:hypothetical protein